VIVAEADSVVSAWLVAVMVTVCGVEMLAGAVYRPDALIVPVPAGLIVQVTAVFPVFRTLAVNCCVWLAPMVALGGVTPTDTGIISVTVAEAACVISVRLVAVMVTVCCEVMLAGAV
jgi:hypothetical protein